MGSAKHDLGPGVAHRIRCPVGPGGHPGHGADTHEFDLVLADEVCQVLLAHWLSVTVDKKDLVFRRSQRFEQKHPQMRHEVTGHAVIRTVQKDVQNALPIKISIIGLRKAKPWSIKLYTMDRFGISEGSLRRENLRFQLRSRVEVTRGWNPSGQSVLFSGPLKFCGGLPAANRTLLEYKSAR